MFRITEGHLGQGMSLAALMLCFFSLQGCDSAPDTSARPVASVRRPDFQEGPFTLNYISRTEADVVFNGATYRIGQDMDYRNLPFSYEWEEDGDVDLRSGSMTYEVEHPLDALDDVLESFADHHAKAAKTKPVKSTVSAPARKPQTVKPSSPPPIRKPQSAAPLKPAKVASSNSKR